MTTTAPIEKTAPSAPALPPTRPADAPDGPGGCMDAPAPSSGGDAGGDAGAPADAFVPDTADKVDWVLGKIADARARAARVRENMELIAKAHDREADALEWRFGAALQAWLRAELGGGAKKSRRLSNGVIGYRTRPVGVTVHDPAAALEWARGNCPEAVAVRLDRAALAARLLDTGESPDFASLTPAEEQFYIR